MSLSEVCYEQINENFWYAMFGEVKLIIDRNTGYFNATKLCQDGGKEFKNWARNKSSQELIQYIVTVEKATARIRAIGPQYAVKGGKDVQNEKVSGTYVSDNLILAIASWLSPEFYVKCNNIIKHYFISEYKNQLQEAERMVNSMREEVMRKTEKLNSIINDVAVKTKDDGLMHVFAIIAKNIDYEKLNRPLSAADDYPFTTARVQKRNFKRRLEDIRCKYPNMELKASLPYNPNSVNWFNYLKENIEYLCTRYNDFKLLNSIPIEVFVADVNNLLYSK